MSLSEEVALAAVGEALQNAGVEPTQAEDVAAGLVWASLRGVDSHGIRLIDHYVAGLRSGRLNGSPAIEQVQTGPSTASVDGDHGFGLHVGRVAMRLATKLARETGVGAVSVANSSHCGALGFFTTEVAKDGFLAVAMTHATRRIATPGSSQMFFGNNPMAIAAPMRGEDPFSYDASTSLITFNEVRRQRETGGMLPLGVAADAHGRMTTDAATAEMLLPIGGYKGFGLSMVVDVFCALLSGMPSGDRVSQMFDGPSGEHRRLGHFFLAVDISRFQPVDAFTAELSATAERIRRLPATEEPGPMVPGDPEKAIAAQRSREGIPVATQLAERLALSNEC
jgi:ureidoglycolate dehydrogenase (NAD+)